MPSNKESSVKKFSPFRERLYEIIFEADTPIGKAFDIVLLIFIFVSVIVVMLETVPTYNIHYGPTFKVLEWIFTVFFTIEYLIRIYTVHRPIKYMTSFFGIVDLLSILPTYIGLFLYGTHSLMIIRALRLLRVFRIFKLGNFLIEGQVIVKALKESRDKIGVFMFFILIVVCIFGSVMYLIEGAAGNEGFDSIPRSVYWAIVTLTTVGYGDISPISPLGQFIAALIMILGYAVIAVPTGIVTSEFTRAYKKRKSGEEINTQTCSYCMDHDHQTGAKFCKSCGNKLHPLDH